MGVLVSTTKEGNARKIAPVADGLDLGLNDQLHGTKANEENKNTDRGKRNIIRLGSYLKLGAPQFPGGSVTRGDPIHVALNTQTNRLANLSC